METPAAPKLEATSWNPGLEEATRVLWESEDGFEFKLGNEKKRNFVIDTPPPYPSGKPWHPGALTQYSQIDMIARSARMRNYNVLYPVGIDRNGLPVEIATERKYRIQLRKTPRDEFIDALQARARRHRSLHDRASEETRNLRRFQEQVQDRLRRLQDVTQWSFIELWNKGLVHIANRPNNYCTDCGTTIADAEIEYEELPTYLVTNRFKVKGSDEEILVATTRPELLEACQLIVVHPDDDRYKRLVGKTAITPIFGNEVTITTHKSVDMAFGTGAVMICSYGDYHDVQLIREFRLKEVVAIDIDGKMTSAAGKYAGMSIKDARSQIIQDLQESKLAVEGRADTAQDSPV